jgi:hypothetical protein
VEVAVCHGRKQCAARRLGPACAAQSPYCQVWTGKLGRLRVSSFFSNSPCHHAHGKHKIESPTWEAIPGEWGGPCFSQIQLRKETSLRTHTRRHDIRVHPLPFPSPFIEGEGPMTSAVFLGSAWRLRCTGPGTRSSAKHAAVSRSMRRSCCAVRRPVWTLCI